MLYQDRLTTNKNFTPIHSIGRSRGCARCKPPLQDPILSFSHTFLAKSAHIRGLCPQWVHTPPNRSTPPYRKSWIRHCTELNESGRFSSGIEYPTVGFLSWWVSGAVTTWQRLFSFQLILVYKFYIMFKQVLVLISDNQEQKTKCLWTQSERNPWWRHKLRRKAGSSSRRHPCRILQPVVINTNKKTVGLWHSCQQGSHLLAGASPDVTDPSWFSWGAGTSPGDLGPIRFFQWEGGYIEEICSFNLFCSRRTDCDKHYRRWDSCAKKPGEAPCPGTFLLFL